MARVGRHSNVPLKTRRLPRFFVRSILAALLLDLLLIASGCARATKGGDTDNPETTFARIRAESRRGDFARARTDAQAAFSAWESRSELKWHWKFRLLDAEMLLLNGETRQAAALLRTSPPAEYADLVPRLQMLQGYVAFREARRPDAKELVSVASRAAHDSSDFELEADCQLLLAAYGSPGDALQTEKIIDGVLQLGKEHDLRYQMAGALVDLGLLRIHQSRFAAAVPHFEQAAQTAKESGAALLYSISLGNLATCYYSLGDFNKALELRKQAIAIQEPAGLTTPLRDSYLELGTSQILQGQTAEAVGSLRHALALASEADTPDIYSLIAGTLASALETTGALDEAETLTRRAIAANKNQDPEAAAALSLNEAAIAEHRGQHEQATKIYLDIIGVPNGSPSLKWSANAALASIYAAKNSPDGNREARRYFEAALHIIEKNRAEQLQSKYRITFLASLIHYYQEYVAFLMREGDAAEALLVADSSRASVLTQDVTGTNERTDHRLIPRIQNLAHQANATFLFYFLAPAQSWIWIVTDRGLNAEALPGEREIGELVRSYRNLLESEKVDPLRSAGSLPARLFQTLVGPAAKSIARNGVVVIVPDGVLHGLNFETLIVNEPAPHYWIQDVTVSIAPSLGILTPGEGRKKPSVSSLLVIGDPLEANANFAPLPHAGEEMNQVRGHFAANRSTLLMGADAVPSAYKLSGPQRFSTLHIAAHAETNERSPLDSAIILSPQTEGYRLYAREIMEVPLTAQLVTLSACRSAGAQTLSGEGPVGFAWAFFQAGAGNVVASLWEVNDRSTAELMNLFYSAIDEGRTYSQALRQAKLAMLRTDLQKPYYWAPFQLYSRRLPRLQ
jgi:CHAT domain-containing protein